MMYGAFDGKR